MSTIPDFSTADVNLAQATVKERFGLEVEIQQADTEVRLSPADRELCVCPALFWTVGDCAFVVARTGLAAYQAMFYYSVRDRFGTGKEEYDNLGDCLITLLKVQEEHDAKRALEVGARS